MAKSGYNYQVNIIVDNQLVNYQDTGSGKVILLLHGWGSNLGGFSELSRLLSKGYRVIRIDFPGFGQSPQPNTDWKVEDYARLVNGFLGKIGVKKLYATVGHSFGGRVIIKGVKLKLLNPEKIILMNSAGVKPKDTHKKYLLNITAKIGKKIASLPGFNKIKSKLQNKLYRLIGNVDYLESKEMKQTFLNVIVEDLLNDADSIKQPTLLIWGENDTDTPLSDGKLLQKKILNSELIIMPDAGHYVFIDQPLIVSERILKFLR